MRVVLGAVITLALVAVLPPAVAAEGDVVVATRGSGDTRQQPDLFPAAQDVHRLTARSDIMSRRRQVTVTLGAAPTAATDAIITVIWGRRGPGSCIHREERSTRTFTPNAIATRSGRILTFDYRGQSVERHDCVVVTVKANEDVGFWDSELLNLQPVSAPGPVARITTTAGPLYRSQTTRLPLTVTNTGGGPLTGATLQPSGPGLKAPAVELPDLTAGASATVMVPVTARAGNRRRSLTSTLTGAGPTGVPVTLTASTPVVVRAAGQRPRKGRWSGKQVSFRVNARGVVRRLEVSLPRGCGRPARTLALGRFHPDAGWWIDASTATGKRTTKLRVRLLKDRLRKGRVQLTVDGCTITRKISARPQL
ncbi:hypothetical protein [Nocardioides daejeonensis]|uniref:hypothetical protein n=1 Tax=Nocardioides daejeonensis TaxID=1046556 RepID=UPI000D74E296|nr:hypothetical protein [Nocardioides daejeonensis]